MQDEPSRKYAAAKHYFGGNAAAYDERRAQKIKWSEENRLVEAYVSRLQRGASVLDVPFGTGRFSSAYLAAGLKVSGADISADMIAQARRRFGDAIAEFDLCIAPAEKLPFADKSFDYLISNRFIKWLPTQAHVEAVAAEFRRVCRNEMLIQVKIEESPIAAIGTTLRRRMLQLLRRYDPRRSTTRYSMQQFRQCFGREGWALAEVMDAPRVGRGVKYLILRQSQSALPAE